MKLLAIGASNSKNSINRKLALYSASLIDNSDIIDYNLSKIELPLYSIDYENEMGMPDEINNFITLINSVEVVIISFAEHNSSYTVAFKNLFDWTSRAKLKMFENKKMILLSTSPGPRGGATVLNEAINRLPRHGADIVGSLSIPSFNDNFSNGSIINTEILSKLQEIVNRLY